MKTAIVYYSLEGNTEYAAKELASKLKADLYKLEPEKAYKTGRVTKFIWGGKSAVFGDEPKLKPFHFEVSDYDLIILGTPIWAGTFVPPIRSFFKEHDLRNSKLAVMTSSLGGAGKCISKLEKEIGTTNIIATLDLIEPLAHPKKENEEKIQVFLHQIMTTQQVEQSI